MPRQRRGPRPARTGGTATRMHLPPQHRRRPPCPGKPAAVRPKARTVSRKVATNRSAQVAPSGRGPALSEREGESRTPQISLFAESAPAVRKSAAASEATPHTAAKQAGKPEREAVKPHADSKSFHAVPAGRPPVRPGRAIRQPACACRRSAGANRLAPPQTAAHRNAFSRMLARSFKAGRKNASTANFPV